MESIFKEHISKDLYRDILITYENMNHNLLSKDEIHKEINKKEKYQKIAMIASGSLGLLSVGMMALNHFDIYEFTQESIRSSAITSVAFVSMNATLSSSLNRLKGSLNGYFINRHLSDLEYDRFEKKLVNDLKSYGIQVQYKEVIKLEDHYDLKSTWEQSDKTNLSENIASKTAEYVKKLVENYIDPAISGSSENLDQKYIGRMLGQYDEPRSVDVSTSPVNKPRKNKL